MNPAMTHSPPLDVTPVPTPLPSPLLPPVVSPHAPSPSTGPDYVLAKPTAPLPLLAGTYHI